MSETIITKKADPATAEVRESKANALMCPVCSGTIFSVKTNLVRECARAILAKYLSCDERSIRDADELRKLVRDSVGISQIQVAIEEAFGIAEIDDADMAAAATLGDLVKLVEDVWLETGYF
jgi:acyl carrier protein